MIRKYKFRILYGNDLKNNDTIKNQLKTILVNRDFTTEFLDYVDESSTIILMYSKDNSLKAFSWLSLYKKLNTAELSWLFSDNDNTSGLDTKYLLDCCIDYCKLNNIKELKFNCSPISWGRIKDKNKLLKSFGYKVVKDIAFDVCISLENNDYIM